jgi:hypothetical protein
MGEIELHARKLPLRVLLYCGVIEHQNGLFATGRAEPIAGWASEMRVGPFTAFCKVRFLISSDLVCDGFGREALV